MSFTSIHKANPLTLRGFFVSRHSVWQAYENKHFFGIVLNFLCFCVGPFVENTLVKAIITAY